MTSRSAWCRRWSPHHTATADHVATLGRRRRRRAAGQPPARLLAPAPIDTPVATIVPRNAAVDSRDSLTPARPTSAQRRPRGRRRLLVDALRQFPPGTLPRSDSRAASAAGFGIRRGPAADRHPFNAAVTAIRRTIPVGRSSDKGPPAQHPSAPPIPRTPARTSSLSDLAPHPATSVARPYHGHALVTPFVTSRTTENTP